MAQIHIFPNKAYRWLIDTWKVAWHNYDQRNANEIYNEVSPYTGQNKRLQTINAGEEVEKREPSYTVGEIVNWYKYYEE